MSTHRHYSPAACSSYNRPFKQHTLSSLRNYKNTHHTPQSHHPLQDQVSNFIETSSPFHPKHKIKKSHQSQQTYKRPSKNFSSSHMDSRGSAMKETSNPHNMVIEAHRYHSHLTMDEPFFNAKISNQTDKKVMSNIEILKRQAYKLENSNIKIGHGSLRHQLKLKRKSIPRHLQRKSFRHKRSLQQICDKSLKCENEAMRIKRPRHTTEMEHKQKFSDQPGEKVSNIDQTSLHSRSEGIQQSYTSKENCQMEQSEFWGQQSQQLIHFSRDGQTAAYLHRTYIINNEFRTTARKLSVIDQQRQGIKRIRKFGISTKYLQQQKRRKDSTNIKNVNENIDSEMLPASNSQLGGNLSDHEMFQQCIENLAPDLISKHSQLRQDLIDVPNMREHLQEFDSNWHHRHRTEINAKTGQQSPIYTANSSWNHHKTGAKSRSLKKCFPSQQNKTRYIQTPHLKQQGSNQKSIAKAKPPTIFNKSCQDFQKGNSKSKLRKSMRPSQLQVHGIDCNARATQTSEDKTDRSKYAVSRSQNQRNDCENLKPKSRKCQSKDKQESGLKLQRLEKSSSANPASPKQLQSRQYDLKSPSRGTPHSHKERDQKNVSTHKISKEVLVVFL